MRVDSPSAAAWTWTALTRSGPTTRSGVCPNHHSIRNRASSGAGDRNSFATSSHRVSPARAAASSSCSSTPCTTWWIPSKAAISRSITGSNAARCGAERPSTWMVCSPVLRARWASSCTSEPARSVARLASNRITSMATLPIPITVVLPPSRVPESVRPAHSPGSPLSHRVTPPAPCTPGRSPPGTPGSASVCSPVASTTASKASRSWPSVSSAPSASCERDAGPMTPGRPESTTSYSGSPPCTRVQPTNSTSRDANMPVNCSAIALVPWWSPATPLRTSPNGAGRESSTVIRAPGRVRRSACAL